MARLREIIRADRRLTIREVAEEVRIAFSTCPKILTEDLQMRRVTAKFVPRLLTVEQNDRVSICTDLRDRAQNNPNFMSSVITGEECWVYGCDTETKQMSSQWNTASSPQLKKTQQLKSNVKKRLIAFFDIDWLVRHEYVLRGQTINKEFYKTALQRLRDVLRRPRPEKWRSGNWILHHDSFPADRADTTNEFLAKHNIPSLPHPPYSPDLASCDFFLFPQLKKTMKVHQFYYIEEIQANVTRQLRAITKSDYQRCFRQWQELWNKCIQTQEHYFEGDKTN